MDMKTIVSSIANSQEVIGQIKAVFNDYFKKVMPVEIGIQKYENYLCFFVNSNDFSKPSWGDTARIVIAIENVINQYAMKHNENKNEIISEEIEEEFEEEKPNIQVINLAEFDQERFNKFFQKEMVDFSQESFKEIQSFLKANYQECFEIINTKKDNPKIDEKSKKFTMFPSAETKSVKENSLQKKILDHLQSDKMLFEEIITHPEALEACAKQVREDKLKKLKNN